MLKIERHKRILEYLRENQFITVENAAAALDVATMTIRRDLKQMEQQGYLARVHGGARLNTWLPAEEDYATKTLKNREVKRRIAKEAAGLVREGMTLYLDAGTTVFELAKLLKAYQGLNILTSDIKIAYHLYESDNAVFVVSGRLEQSTGMILPEQALDALDHININYAFMGASTLSDNFAISTPSFAKAALKRKVIERAKHTVLLCDKTKYGLTSMVHIASILDFDLCISDISFSKEQLMLFDRHRLTYCKVETD